MGSFDYVRLLEMEAASDSDMICCSVLRLLDHVRSVAVVHLVLLEQGCY